MNLLKNFDISQLTLLVKLATNKIAHFFDAPASLFVLEDNEYSASRLAGTPIKCTLLSV